MNMQSYIDEIRLALAGEVLDVEADDAILAKIVNKSLREMQRYICSTELITVPYSTCIDLSEYDVNAVTKVFRVNPAGISSDKSVSIADPMQIGLWKITNSAGNMLNYNTYLNNIIAYSTMMQSSNTLSTDLEFYYEDKEQKLYINTSLGEPDEITIQYIPRYNNVEDVTSDYWIDNIVKMAVAYAKIYVGRVRSRYTQSNALWTQDGERIGDEGHQELVDLQTYLQANTQLIYPYD